MKKFLNHIMFAVALLGILLSTYLWWFQATGEFIPCTTGGCDHILKSEYSYMLGVPMSIFGVFYYVVVALLVFQKFFIKHKIINILLFISIIWGVIFSIYLRYLEFFVIGDICSWCWISVLFITILLVCFVVEKYSKK